MELFTLAHPVSPSLTYCSACVSIKGPFSLVFTMWAKLVLSASADKIMQKKRQAVIGVVIVNEPLTLHAPAMSGTSSDSCRGLESLVVSGWQ